MMALSKGFTTKTVKINLNYDAKKLEMFMYGSLPYMQVVNNERNHKPGLWGPFCSERTRSIYNVLFSGSCIKCPRCPTMMKLRSYSSYGPTNLLEYLCNNCKIHMSVCCLCSDLCNKIVNIIKPCHITFVSDRNVKLFKKQLDERGIPYTHKQVDTKHVCYFDDDYYWHNFIKDDPFMYWHPCNCNKSNKPKYITDDDIEHFKKLMI